MPDMSLSDSVGLPSGTGPLDARREPASDYPHPFVFVAMSQALTMVELHEKCWSKSRGLYAAYLPMVGLRHRPISGSPNRKAIAGTLSNLLA